MNIKTIILLLALASNYVSAESCLLKQPSNAKETLVGFLTNERTTIQGDESGKSIATVVGNFRIIASITNGVIHHNDGSTIKNGKQFWSVTPKKEEIELMSVGSFLDQMGKDHCVYYGSSTSTKDEMLFTSTSDSSLIPPSSQHSSQFLKLNKTCVVSGDRSKCRRPKLIAVSDVNDDRNYEYWATEPYMWDVGITVWELKDGKLSVLLKTCVGCAG